MICRLALIFGTDIKSLTISMFSLITAKCNAVK